MGLLQRRQNSNIVITNNFFDNNKSFDWLIVGLGNPGKQYQTTRHNIGFMAIDNFTINNEFSPWIIKKDLKSEISSSYIINKKILAIKPQTFMNESGEAIVKVINFYKFKPQNIIIIYDDYDLPFGVIRYRSDGSSGGHKGMQSIINTLKYDNFNRVRVGIKQEINKKAGEVVLKKFNQNEIKNLEKVFNEINVLINELIFGTNSLIQPQTIKVF